MARRGLLGRALGRLLGIGSSRPSEPPERTSPPPPPPPPGRPPGGGGGSEHTYRSVWYDDVPLEQRQRISDDTGYSQAEVFQAHYELFVSIPGVVEETRQEQLHLWDIYLTHMVATSERRNDPGNPFWSELGLDPRDPGFDWDEWRNAMGYSRRNQ